jgi:ABC-type branched-subunit amino acid transport system substrate-binding protein
MLALPVVIALAAAACGSDREAAAPETTAAAAETTAAAAAETTAAAEEGTETTAAAAAETTVAAEPEGETFGDLTWPCGPGDGANTDDGSEPGVTADSVSIATGDDAGFATSPGLNKEMTDAVNALAAKCNELGGINGREIKVNYYDAAITNVAAAIQGACDDNNFFLVGEGWSLDDGQEEIRKSCGLPAAPTYTVSARFAMAPGVFQGVPNPADETPAGIFAHVAELFPEEIKAVATLGGNFSATQETIEKFRAVAPEYGFSFVGERIEYDIFGGVTDWTPIVKQVQDTGATMLVWSGSCLPNLQKFAQTAVQNGLDIPIVTDANHYAASCAAANTDGSMDNVYIRFAFVPFEEAAENKATQDYIDIVEADGGDIAMLGMQAASSFMLWVQASVDCGAQLTRDCVIEKMSGINEWTAGGLHAPTDPGGNHPPSCNTMLKLEGTSYVRVVPTEAASFDCDPSWVGKVSGVPALEALALDENRHPTK